MSCARSARSPRSMPHPSPWCSAAAPRWRARTGWSAECPRMWISRSCRCRRRRSAAAVCIASGARCAAVSRRRSAGGRLHFRPKGSGAGQVAGREQLHGLAAPLQPASRGRGGAAAASSVSAASRSTSSAGAGRSGTGPRRSEGGPRCPAGAQPGPETGRGSHQQVTRGRGQCLAVRVMVSSDCSVRDTRSAWDCAGHRGNLELPHGPLRPSATAGCRTHAFPAAATGRAGRIPALSARCTRGRRKCCLC